MRPPNLRPKYVGANEGAYRPGPQYDGVREYGRIRVYEDASLLLDNVLRLERDRIAMQRRTTIETDPTVKTQPFNRQIKLIDQLLDEVERMRDECGWE